ncbi:hypothetical protein [Streptomyces vilmorinianum]|uniref:hypothetical protein n=1 Tax=Streptomyces vilmorinianum TaxID=3051092 RepID=UPI0010FB0136|nr:hypothetical protein [Streptomyces vilmorinianum]
MGSDEVRRSCEVLAEARAAADSASAAKLKIAYESVIKIMAQQDTTLANYRNRATGLFTVAALIATFASNVGFIVKDHPPPLAYLIWMMASLGVVLVCALAVLWPVKDWSYAAAEPVGVLLQKEVAGEEEKSLHRGIVRGHLQALQDNGQIIKQKAAWFRYGVLALGLEMVAVLTSALVAQP